MNRNDLQLTSSSTPKNLVPGQKIWAIVDAVESRLGEHNIQSPHPDLDIVRKSGTLASFAKSYKAKMVTFSHDLFTEHHVMLENPDTLMIRTSISSSSPKNLRHVSFTSFDLRELVNSTLDLLLDNEKGIWNLVNSKEHYPTALTGTNENVRF